MPTPEVAAQQRKLITDRFPEALPRDQKGRESIEYLYREGHIVVREEYLDRVRQLLPRAEGQPEEAARTAETPDVTAVVSGVVLLRVEGLGVLAALDRIRDTLGAGVAAPDHIVSITGDALLCPATEPDPVPRSASPDPHPCVDRLAGEGVRVVVVDTGFDDDAPYHHSWLHDIHGDADPAIGGGSPRALDAYAGHGTFIAGAIRTVAPKAEVIVRRLFRTAGADFETDLVRALNRVVDRDYPDVISMSAGTHTWDATGLLTFQVFQETRLARHKGLVLITAAGNNSSRAYFWPAAAPWAVSVGALSASWRERAGYSNFGHWVDVYAPGTDLVNAFPYGRYTYHEDPRTGQQVDFPGMARWSGTSFSTPLVAGLVAARMSRTGENGQAAAAALLAQARTAALPGVGAVLLPT
jgi:hypothetical protein